MNYLKPDCLNNGKIMTNLVNLGKLFWNQPENERI